MSEPYTIRIFVPDGDPEGAKIVDLLNWTGVGIAFPRLGWPKLRGTPEFRRSGVYILSGPAEGTEDDLPTVYVGQGDAIAVRIDLHQSTKEFWDWGYAFVSKGNQLNRAHITWLEYALIDRAKEAGRCHLDNATEPKEPGLSVSDRADTQGFLRQMLRILPLLGVRVFEKPAPVATPGIASPTPSIPTPAGEDQGVMTMAIHSASPSPSIPTPADARDTVVVPAQEPGFTVTFLGKHSWHAIRIGGGMLEKIKYIAAYQTAPVSAVTHYARVDRIEPYGDDDKYRLIFAVPATTLPQPIPFADAPPAAMKSPRYTRLAALLSAKKVTDLFPSSKNPPDG